MVEKVVIMGAAGRDFHNFNIYFKNNPRYRVVAFTAAQIPNIEGRVFPPELAGEDYPDGVPIVPESRLESLIVEHRVDLVAFSYSDVPHEEVMHKASVAMAGGADFILIGASYTMLRSTRPVVTVCAVRTGCGKSQTTRKICDILSERGLRTVVVRHPMPYGDLVRQRVQRFSRFEDFKVQQCTIEEREEYEPLLERGIVVYAGIDYEKILRAAESEADVVVWDGGNNDTPFFLPDVHVVVFDPHRPGHERRYYPGETNLLMADIAVINKVDSAPEAGVRQVRETIRRHNARARITLAESLISVDRSEAVKGRRVLVVEDGPTLTHGEMPWGAGLIAAKACGAAQVVDPRPYAVGSIAQIFRRYPHIGPVLPAMGYGSEQVADLRQTLDAAETDVVLFATPIDLPRLIDLKKEAMRVRYEYRDHGQPRLEDLLMEKLAGKIS